jgi:hypothetical protein
MFAKLHVNVPAPAIVASDLKYRSSADPDPLQGTFVPGTDRRKGSMGVK